MSIEKRAGLNVARAARLLEKPFAAWLLCLCFSLLMLYHYVVPLGAVLFTEGIEGQDCGQMIWNLWVVNEAISGGHNPYATSLVYYPVGAANLVYHSLAAGFFPVTFLVKQFSGGDALYPFYAYRIIILLSFSLILFFSYATLRRAGFSRMASLIPAIAYTFSDFYMEHVIHLNHLAGFFIPLTALALLRAYQEPRLSNALTASVAASCAVYFTEFSLYIYMAALFLGATLCAFRAERKLVLERIRRLGLRSLLLSLGLFLLIITPYLYNLFTVEVLKPKAFEASLYSANLAGFFIPDGAQTPLYGSLFVPLRTRITAGMGEPGIFLGFPLLLAALAGLLAERRRAVRAITLTSMLFFVLSLGPTLKIFARDTLIQMPYSWLSGLPPFNAGRTPVRFIVMGMFLLTIVAASGLSWMEKRLSEQGWPSRLRVPAMMLLLFWTIAEVYSPVARQKPFVPPKELGRIIPGPVLNLPLARNDGYAAMLQVLHHQPIATGYLARYTPQQWQQFTNLERTFYRGGPQFCSTLERAGIRNLIIAPESIAPHAPGLAPLDLYKCSLNIVDLRREDAGDALKNMPEEPERFPLIEAARPIDFRAEESDQYLWYGWSGREACCRWSNSGRAAVVFALERPRAGRLEISMSPFVVPGKLDQQHVEVQLNGQPLGALDLKRPEPVTHSMELPAGLLKERNVLTLSLPDAESPAALKLSEDTRLLGVNVQWMKIDPAPDQ